MSRGNLNLLEKVSGGQLTYFLYTQIPFQVQLIQIGFHYVSDHPLLMLMLKSLNLRSEDREVIKKNHFIDSTGY